jgi:glycosyltransferase involved in cell wall biosynthesis
MRDVSGQNETVLRDLLVTVITPTYNQGGFIEDTIKSVVLQTYKNIEYIIIDNESNDRTEQIVTRYKTQYGNIQYIREKDSGQAAALNKGFDLAKGSIVCWINSDDYYYDNLVIEKIVNIFKDKEDVDVIYGNGYCCDKRGNLLYHHIINTKHLSMKYLNILCPILQPSSFWRTNCIRLEDMYTYGFDWIFFREMYINKFKFYYFNEYLSVYRMYDSNKTGADNWKRRREIYGVVRNNLGTYNIISIGFYIIYISYWFSQKTGLSWIKNIVRKVSKLIGKKI